MNCTAVAIKCVKSRTKSIDLESLYVLTIGLKGVIFGIGSLYEAKQTVDQAIQVYHWSLSVLNVWIGAEVLHWTTDSQKASVLTWLCSDDVNKVHNLKRGERTPETGDWFLKSDDFTDWLYGNTNLLICKGLGIVTSFY